MITELLPDNTFYNEMIDKEIEKLQNQKNNNDTNRHY